MRTYLFQNPSYSRIFWALTLSMLVYSVGPHLAYADTRTFGTIESLSGTTDTLGKLMCYAYKYAGFLIIFLGLVITAAGYAMKWFSLQDLKKAGFLVLVFASIPFFYKAVTGVEIVCE